MTRSRLVLTLPALVLAQLALVALGVWPQLSARAAGDEIQLRVRPVDPIDPFRGAYVTLSYPDLRPRPSEGGDGTVFVRLREEDGLWVADGWSRTRPDGGTFLRCTDRWWEVRCGIESWFVPQDEAAALERRIAGGTLVATVAVDGRGNAAVVGLSPRARE